jgi:hypothetical protein
MCRGIADRRPTVDVLHLDLVIDLARVEFIVQGVDHLVLGVAISIGEGRGDPILGAELSQVLLEDPSSQNGRRILESLAE